MDKTFGNVTDLLERIQRLEIDKKYMILNTHRLLKNKYKNSYLWVFIRDICGVGSGSAITICQEFGWNPDQAGNEDLI